MTKTLCVLLPLVAALSFGCKSGHTSTREVRANATCPISGQPVDASNFVLVDGTKVYTCCAKCMAKVDADPKGALAKAYPSK